MRATSKRDDPRRSRKPVQFDNAHPAIIETRRLHKTRGLDFDGLYHLRRVRALRIRVGPDSLDRALGLADSVFKAAEARGHTVALAPESDSEGGVRVIVDGQPVDVSVHERTVQVPHAPTKEERDRTNSWSWYSQRKHDLRPTGELSFIIQNVYGGRTKWSDGQRSKLEDKIDDILDGIEAAARNLRAQRQEFERREREWQAEREKAAQEAMRREELQEQLARWRTARDIRAFVAEMRQARAPSIAVEGGEFDSWLSWALQYANRIDPVAALRQSSQQ